MVESFRPALVAIGGNLPAPGHLDLRSGLNAAIAALAAPMLRVTACSPWYETAPQPPSDQPWFLNGILAVQSAFSAADLLAHLLMIERQFGRVRSTSNAARTLDLDILDYDGQISPPGADPILPHPRLHERAFVLLPLFDLCPDWRHPVDGRSLATLIAALAPDQAIRRLE